MYVPLGIVYFVLLALPVGVIVGFTAGSFLDYRARAGLSPIPTIAPPGVSVFFSGKKAKPDDDEEPANGRVTYPRQKL